MLLALLRRDGYTAHSCDFLYGCVELNVLLRGDLFPKSLVALIEGEHRGWVPRFTGECLIDALLVIDLEELRRGDLVEITIAKTGVNGGKELDEWLDILALGPLGEGVAELFGGKAQESRARKNAGPASTSFKNRFSGPRYLSKKLNTRPSFRLSRLASSRGA